MAWSGRYVASQLEGPYLTLTPSANATFVGVPVEFAGTTVGLNVTSVTYEVVAPNSTQYGGAVNVSLSEFNFTYTFDATGNWTVFCSAISGTGTEALSGSVVISVGEAPPPSYYGVPVFWLGISILVISAISLAYLVWAIRKREAEEERKASAADASAPPRNAGGSGDV